MTDTTRTAAGAAGAARSPVDEVPCPFCGLLCDDLRVTLADDGAVRASTPAPGPFCERAAAGFRQAGAAAAAPPQAFVDGDRVKLDRAIDHAAGLLAASRAPLFGGLATDVNGAREALRLAERAQATVDHANGPALLQNVHIVQRDGWIATTQGEVRNRADHVVVVGSPALLDAFPRLLERVLLPPVGLLPERLARRRFTLIGPWRPEQIPAPLRGRTALLAAGPARLPEIIGLLRARLSDRPLHAAGASVPDGLTELVQALRASQYTALLWSAGDLPAAGRALTIDALARLLRTLNETGRAAGMPLAGSAGDVTVNQVSTWLTGYPARLSFAGGSAAFDAARFDAATLLADGGCDLLLWLNSLNPELTPPAATAPPPTILIGHPALRPALAAPPAVFIPVGVPGVDHAGHLYRGEGIVALPLRRLRDGGAPSAATVLKRIHDRLTARAARRAG